MSVAAATAMTLDKKERAREQSRRYRAANPEVIKARCRAYYENNREHVIRKAQEWLIANPERKYAWNKKRRLAKYGLTPEQYDAMLENQKHACAICELGFTSTRSTHVDHNHTTGLARAILCLSCNQALGYLEKDGGKWLVTALAYLERFK